MDFRMRNFKENKGNYNSMAQFSRHFEPLSPNGADLTQTSRIKQIQTKLNNLMQSQRAESQGNNSLFLKLEQRVERIEHRMLRFDQNDSRILNKNQSFKDARNSATYKYNNNTQDSNFFKESMLSDLSAQRQEIRKQNIKTQQIQIKQLRLEQELRDWINSHKLEMNMRLNHNEQLRGSEIGKQKKYQYQYQNIKSIVNTLENKVELELDSKGRGLMSLKQDFQHSLQTLREQMVREIKNDKDTFTKLVKDIKDSFQVLRDALGKDRQHVKQAIFQIQNNQQNSYNKTNRSIQILASTTNERHQKMQKKIIAVKDDWNSFKLTTNQKLQDFKTLLMNIQSTVLQSLQNSKAKENKGDNLEVLKEELGEWKKLSEQKNLNVFRQISNAMKVLRIQWRKEHDDLSKELEETGKSIKQIRQSVNKKIDKELLSVTQVIGEQFEAFTLELQQINDFVALSKKQTEEKIIKELADVKESFANKSVEAVKLVTQGQQKMQNLEVSLKKQLKEQSNRMKDEIAIVQQNTKIQIQSLVTSITEDNQQWQKDLKDSIKSIKDSFNQQIQTNNITLNKQNSQSLKKVQNSIESFKKFIQAGLSNERGQTVRQISKVTEQLTSLIGQWSTKIKKQRETGENSIKQQLVQIKKISTQGTAQVKQNTQQIRSKLKQKTTQDEKKISQLKGSLDQNLVRIKTSEEESNKVNKKIQSIKIEFQGKIKMNYDKLLLEVNAKKQSQIKAKEDQSKTKYAEIDKKITDSNAKVKSDLLAQLNKTSKTIEEELGKNSKKVQLINSSYKKDIQVQVEKQRKFCIDELAKVKAQIETKIKARDEKNITEVNAKKDAEVKQKQEELKSKLADIEKKTNDSLSKVKTDLLTELSKSKTTNSEQISKLKTQFDNKIKVFDEIKTKKESQSKAKQSQLKQKESQLKNRTIQLDKKIEVAKKDMQTFTSSQLNKLKSQLEAKIKPYNQQAELKLKIANELNVKAREEDKARLELLSKQIQKLREDTNNKIAEIKGVSLASTKEKEEETSRMQEQKLTGIKLELTKAISQSTSALQKDINARIDKLTEDTSKLQSEVSLTFSSSKQAINKVQANLLVQHQKNKAVYQKMSSDILDVADSLMAVIAQMRPAQK